MSAPALAPHASKASRRAAAGPSPFTAAYTRLGEVFPTLGVIELTPAEPDPAPADGWLQASSLAADPATLDRFLAWDEEQVRRDYGQPGRPDVIASFGLHRYAWGVCLLATIPWFLHRRVPRIPVDAVSYHRGRGRLAVRLDAFACLPDDPAALLPGARVVPDEEALRAELRASVAEHLAPVLDAFAPRMRRGRRALWGMATDEIVEGLWYIGSLLGEEDRAVAETGRLLPGNSALQAPYAGGASFRALPGKCGEDLRTRDRASCCLFYTLRPQDTCVTCPRTGDAERVERLSATS
ncbi:(2Fe-2S)-binding protein [Streptomyces boninensis]|uniref:(2Fe-2S)-binding protein n=1 Tax=Streptomyces boninensis TaxID=2039455 RepID=UPI003B210C51